MTENTGLFLFTIDYKFTTIKLVGGRKPFIIFI